MLGGGFLQNFVIRKARDLGYYVYCLDANPNAEGLQSANESAVINIVDEDACLAFAREKNVDGKPCGVCFKPKSVAQVKDSVNFILGDEQLKNMLVNNALARLHSEYNIHTVWDKLIHIWNLEYNEHKNNN